MNLLALQWFLLTVLPHYSIASLQGTKFACCDAASLDDVGRCGTGRLSLLCENVHTLLNHNCFEACNDWGFTPFEMS